MVFKNSIPDIEEYITMYQSENVPIQTFILICGTLYKLKKNYCIFDCIKYKLFSITSAIIVCFTIFHIFNLEYPIESSIVWFFIQKYLFTLNTKYDKVYHNY